MMIPTDQVGGNAHGIEGDQEIATLDGIAQPIDVVDAVEIETTERGEMTLVIGPEGAVTTLLTRGASIDATRVRIQQLLGLARRPMMYVRKEICTL